MIVNKPEICKRTVQSLPSDVMRVVRVNTFHKANIFVYYFTHHNY